MCLLPSDVSTLAREESFATANVGTGPGPPVLFPEPIGEDVCVGALGEPDVELLDC